MKELSIEEKAQRYDKALEKARQLCAYPTSKPFISDLQDLFPELAESEDERIRNFLIKQANSVLDSITDDDEEVPTWKSALAWLEKQGKNNIGISEATKQELEDNLNKALEKETPESCNEFLEKQGEQKSIKEHNACEFCEDRYGCVSPCSMKLIEEEKPVDKVGPKFKVGDKIKFAKEPKYPAREIIAIQNDAYYFDEVVYLPFNRQDEWELVGQKPTVEMKTPEESLGIDSDTYNKIVDECVYGEQKPDKVEPKFKVGDWVVRNGETLQISGIDTVLDGTFHYWFTKGTWLSSKKMGNAMLWTIQDAKDGDVLVSEHPLCGLGTWYCIFKSLDDDESMTVYCYLTRDGRFETKKELCFDKDPYNTKPATKEQRNTLLKAMSDAGYTFDFDKKELKKIEQKPAWSEEDEWKFSDILALLRGGENCHYNKPDLFTWLKSIKDRVQPQKQEWSDVDKDILFHTINDLKLLRDTVSKDPYYTVNTIDVEREINLLESIKDRVQPKQEWSEEDNEIIETICKEGDLKPSERVWLKSIKDRVGCEANCTTMWKPTEEQIDAIRYVSNFDYGGHKATLVSLYEQLKKLRGE